MVQAGAFADAELKQLQDEFDQLRGPQLPKLEELEEDVDEELEERGILDDDADDADAQAVGEETSGGLVIARQ